MSSVSEDVCISDGEEYVDLDLELSSSDESSSHNQLQSVRSFPLREVELEQNLKELEAKWREDENDESNLMRVIGQANVGPTTQMKSVFSAWITNARRFSTKLNLDGQSSPLESITGLRAEFLTPLRKYINFWFPVQEAVLPSLLQSNFVLPPRDIVICSPTGSGKTLCYVLPILNALRITRASPSSVFALIIAPVKNLVEQIYKEFEKLNVFGAKIVALLGQNDYQTERSILYPDGSKKSKVHIIVGTPGRFVEHLLDEIGLLDLSMLRYLVIDEVDRMQDTARMEWLELVERYANVSRQNTLDINSLTNCSKNCWLQRILSSATLSLDVNSLHIWNLRCPLLFQAEREINNGTDTSIQHEQLAAPSIILPDSLTHKLIVCKLNFKPLLLYQQIKENFAEWNRIIIFVNKKETGKRLSLLLSFLSKKKITVAEFSSILFKDRRKKLLRDFQNDQIRVLIACDILSRGIDVLDVDCVINYDVPINERIFVHRAGRTARAMKKGALLSLTTKEEKMKLKKLLTGRNLWDGIQEFNKTALDLDDQLIQKYEKALLHLKKKVEQKS